MQKLVLNICMKHNSLPCIEDNKGYYDPIDVIAFFDKNSKGIVVSQNRCKVRNKDRNTYSKNWFNFIEKDFSDD